MKSACRAPNLEANKFAMLSVPDTPSTLGLFTFLTADQNLSFNNILYLCTHKQEKLTHVIECVSGSEPT